MKIGTERKKRITIVIGTRPELIKLGPLVHELHTRPRVQIDVVFTGQHRAMLEELAPSFSITPTHTLEPTRRDRSLTAMTTELLEGLDAIYCRTLPDLVICQGDTTSAMAAAMAAFHRKVPIAHVEAGLRSGDLSSPYPEEGNRRTISSLATHHFAPTEQARENLLAEGVHPDSVHMTGNTIIDALLHVATREDLSLPRQLEECGPFVLITLHRRENLARFEEILAGIGALANRFPELTFAWPVHPNPLVQAGAEALLNTTPNAMLLPPLSYEHFVAAMKYARLILTDSGGVQEEAPTLGTPVLVLREETERTEGLRAGAADLVGTKARAILEAGTIALRTKDRERPPAIQTSPYGDGRAAKRIADVLVPPLPAQEGDAFESPGSDLTNS